MDERPVIRQGGVPIGYVEGKTAVLDDDFLGCDIGRKLTQSGWQVRWRAGVAKELARASKEKPQLRRIRVHQLNASVDPSKKFITYAALQKRFGGLCAADYTVVFDGQLDTDSPHELYERFNASPLPKGYCGHRLAISDVVELYCDSESEFLYLDAEGFIPVEMKKEEHK